MVRSNGRRRERFRIGGLRRGVETVGWEKAKTAIFLDATTVYVEPGSTPIVFDIDLPAPPAIAWDWINSAERQRMWQISADSIEARHPNGVWSVGTTSHCVHGGAAIEDEGVDSKPFRYFTLRSTVPFLTAEDTWELTPGPEPETTHLQIRVRSEGRFRA